MHFDAILPENALCLVARVGGDMLNDAQTSLMVLFMNLKPRRGLAVLQ